MNKKLSTIENIIPWILLLCTILYSAGEPRWFKNGRPPQYSSTLNYVGVGEGITFSDAQSAAQAVLPRKLKLP